MKFINFELDQIGGSPLGQNNVVDTLPLAQRKFPGAPANLDALCRRFGIDGSRRTRHGALLDSELLAEVYLNLIGGRQRALGLDGSDGAVERSEIKRVFREPRHFPVSEAELEAHKAYIATIKNAIWLES
jgi:DNA polymerase-3 subunit epsilon